MRLSTLIDTWAWTLVAGVVGAVTSMQFIRGLSGFQKFAMVVTGFIMSAFLTDPLTHWIAIPPDAKFGVAFMVGLFGWTIAGKLLLTISTLDLHKLVEDVVHIFKRK